MLFSNRCGVLCLMCSSSKNSERADACRGQFEHPMVRSELLWISQTPLPASTESRSFTRLVTTRGRWSTGSTGTVEASLTPGSSCSATISEARRAAKRNKKIIEDPKASRYKKTHTHKKRIKKNYSWIGLFCCSPGPVVCGCPLVLWSLVPWSFGPLVHRPFWPPGPLAQVRE